MRKTSLYVLMISMIFCSDYSDAASIYYFEGTVSDLFYDGGGILSDEGVKIGDRVYASFRVNFDKDGYYILNNGEMVVPESPPQTNNPYWYFFATLINGTLLPEVNGGLNNDPEDISEYHIGYSNSGPFGNTGALQGGSGDSYINVQKQSNLDTHVENWIVGEKLKGIIVGYSNEDWSIMWADMTLTKIIQVPQVPSEIFYLLLSD